MYGSYERLREFEDAARRTKPALTMSLSTLLSHLHNTPSVYSFYRGVISEVQAIADARLFLGYENHLTFGVLSLDGRGLAQYGDVTVVINDRYIAQRASVTETDSVAMVKKHVLSDELPRGFRATWNQRAKLAVAKLGHLIRSDTTLDTFPDLILREGEGSFRDDFFPVQIYGEVNKATFRSVHVRHRAENAVDSVSLEAARALCNRDGIAFELVE